MGRETLLEVWDGSQGLPKSQGHVWRSSQRSGLGREALAKVWDRSGGHLRGPGPVWSLSGDPYDTSSGSGGPPVGLKVPPRGLGGPTGGSERLGRPSRRSGMGLEVLPEVCNGSGGLPIGQGHVWRPFQRSRMGQ